VLEVAPCSIDEEEVLSDEDKRLLVVEEVRMLLEVLVYVGACEREVLLYVATPLVSMALSTCSAELVSPASATCAHPTTSGSNDRRCAVGNIVVVLRQPENQKQLGTSKEQEKRHL